MEQSSCGFLFVRHVNGSFYMTMNTSQSNMLKPNKVKKEMDVFFQRQKKTGPFPHKINMLEVENKTSGSPENHHLPNHHGSRISFLRL